MSNMLSPRRASEEALFHGYSQVGERDAIRIEHRPCACGATVTADPDSPGKGVAAHNFTSRHRGWRSASPYPWIRDFTRPIDPTTE